MGLTTQSLQTRHTRTTGILKLRSTKMGKFDGTFVMESHQNLTPCMLALGMTEEMLKKMLDPKNVITMTVVENKDGSFTSGTTQSLAPEFNHSSTFKIGETTTVKEPWPATVTVTKKSETTWNTRTEMGGKVMIAETIEKNLEAIMKIMTPQLKWEDFEKIKPDLAMRIIERPDGVCVEEKFAGQNKTYSVKFDEEYEYSAPDWNVDDKRVTTKTAPGCFTTVCRAKKDGKVSEWSMTITDCGMNVHIKVGGLEAEETYKRVADVEGTWRPVAHSGMDSYLRCLGITGALAEEMMSNTCSEYFTMELLPGGKVKTTTNSKWLPAEMVMKIGEAYCFEMPGMGKIEGVMTEIGADTFLNVMKLGGKKSCNH